jgi:chromosome segregation protein
MRVKRLDLLGFKSFATKTGVHFEPGVTAIVGPNGSGKSNIVDAVRWVLGEHNPRDVRAPRLEDIIFNGTDIRAPLSMAEVSLLLENDRGLLPIAFSEVLITRRIYRSGESECFINHSPCRLRDIHELFLGTGLGGSTYAIITQGHIDLVLSSKPEERRLVFEEASGVAKYLAKKQEAGRRLDDAEEDLLRLTDIISEVKRQLSALERQATKARQYKDSWDQLKLLELRLAVEELRHGRQRRDQLGIDADGLGAQRTALEDQRQQTMSSLEAFNTQIAGVHAALQELRAKVVELSSRSEQHEQQRALKTRWIEELSQQRQQLAREVMQLEERLSTLDGQRQQLEAERGTLSAKRQELEVRLAATREAVGRFDGELTDANGSLDQATRALAEAASQVTQLRNAMTKASTDLQALEAQSSRAQTQRDSIQKRRDAAGLRRQQVESEAASIGGRHQEVQEQLGQVRHALARAQDGRDQWSGRLRHAREQLLHEQAQVKFLDDMARRDESFPDPVKALMADRPDGVVGLLADLFNPEPGYEQALEAALGELTTAIVVRDREALRRCQERLVSQPIDSARFVVLADCSGGRREPILISGGQFRGRLTQFVRFDPSLASLAEWLFGRWAVIDDLSRLLDGFTAGLWVSRSGDRWDGRCWRFTGSSKSVARIGLTHRLDQARQHAVALQQEAGNLQQAWQQAEAQCQSLTVQESELRAQVDQLVPARARLDAQISEVEREVHRLDDERRSLDEDLQQWATQGTELTGRCERLGEQLGAEEMRHRDVQMQVRQAQQRLEDVNRRRQDDMTVVAQLETALAAHGEYERRAEIHAKELHHEHLQAEASLAAKRQQDEGVSVRSAELAQQIADHEAQTTALMAEQALVQGELDQAAQRLADEERARDHVLPKLLEVEQAIAGLAKRIDEQARQLAELDFRRERILERLHEVYRIEESVLSAEELSTSQPISDEDRRNLLEQIQRLKAKVESNGPVSMGSVEEYDELAKRSEFLKTQQEDLVRSRDDLKATIAQINRTARTQFRETFATIRTEFQSYFTKLFNGGQADLILLNEDDVLDSGIEIVARPPGKRLQSISLLSGGERAITAIALLFALFKVRPSPFCILDEIDASLDEANVDRFTRVLEEFLSLSQFILITHNKKTITKADSLYGVTMEQPGISKLVSVKLRAKRATAETPGSTADLGGAASVVPSSSTTGAVDVVATESVGSTP